MDKATLHASREDYLEAILVLQKQKGMVRSVDVARLHGGVKAKREPCRDHFEGGRVPYNG